MDVETVRKICLAFTAATESIKWGNDLVFSVGDKMFCATSFEEPFKCSASLRGANRPLNPPGLNPPLFGNAIYVFLLLNCVTGDNALNCSLRRNLLCLFYLLLINKKK